MPRTEAEERRLWLDEYMKLYAREPGFALHWLLMATYERVTLTERTILLDELEEGLDLRSRERGE
jgi:hypothetical protein